MARTNVPLSAWVLNSNLADPAGTDCDATNDHEIPVVGQSGRVLLRISNTALADKVVTIPVGDNPPAQRAGLGALTVTVATTATEWIGPLESARFIQDDGKIHVDLASGHTGKITAFQLPAGA